MRSAHPFRWFGAALLATLVLLHSGYDTSEGSDHVAAALHWMETGRLGQQTRAAEIFLPGPDGLFYPVHELGNILWVTPAAAAGLALERLLGSPTLAGASGRIAVMAASFFPALLVTLTALGFWKLLEWRFAFPLPVRLAASALLVFATFLLPYSRSLADVVSTGCLLIWGAAFAARAAMRGDSRSAAIAGLLLGSAMLTRIPAAVAVAPIFAAMVARARPGRRWRLAVIAIAAALPCALAMLWFNNVRTGSPFVPAFMHPQFHWVQPGTGSMWTGIAGFLFSPGKSMFLFSPALLLAAAGLPRMYREARIECLAIAATFILFLMLHGSLLSWHGDWGWGPRYIVFILPLLWLPAAFVLRDLRAGSAGRRAAIALLAASMAVQAAALVINWQYQYQVMLAEGRLSSEMYWRADNQFTDGLRAAARNLARSAGADLASPEIAGASRLTSIASSGINVWWVTALRAGVTPAAVVPVVIGLALFARLAWRRALLSVRG